MKRIASLLMACVMVFCMIPIQANAASSEAQAAAEKLYAYGLFSGTGTDANGKPIFDLDRVPTRHEAVTMLVRLLGKESEAKAGTWATPFSDVADWAKPYVGYAYENKLTSGTSATTFSGNEPVSAAQYTTFVLRALGYDSTSDFQWDKPWELSDEMGLTDGRFKSGNTTFTRGDVAIISASALNRFPKGGGDSLLVTLAESGAIASSMGLPLTNGKPVGEAWNVEYELMSGLTAGNASVHSYTAQTLDNGYTRFTLVCSVPANMRIGIFSAKNDNSLLYSAKKTTGEKSTLEFDLDDAALHDTGHFAVTFNSDFGPIQISTITMDAFELTDGQPIGEEQAIDYELKYPKGFVTIYGWTAQQLDNGYTRSTIECSFSKDIIIEIMRPFSQSCKIGATNGNTKIVFDLKDDMMCKNGVVGIKFYTEMAHDGDALFLSTDQLSHITLTDGKPVGAAKELSFGTENALGGGRTGQIHSCTAQMLDNGYTRLAVEYTLPAKLKAHLFNPPNGDIVRMNENSGTSGEKSVLLFDINNEELAEVSTITINFHDDDDNSYWVFLHLS